MFFYISRVLVLGLLLDIPITGLLFQKYPSGRIARWIAPYTTVLVYFISALIWIRFYGVDPRFQGQGALGLAVFFMLGILFSVIRLVMGVFMSLMKRKSY